jgi:hypothetical protein
VHVLEVGGDIENQHPRLHAEMLLVDALLEHLAVLQHLPQIAGLLEVGAADGFMVAIGLEHEEPVAGALIFDAEHGVRDQRLFQRLPLPCPWVGV